MTFLRTILSLVLMLGLAAGALAQSDLTVLQTEAPRSMDPANQTATYTAAVLYPMYEGLVEMNQRQEVVPGLATEWDANEDGTVFTFTLREGVTFHDGTPLDADAVVVSFERLLDPEVGLAGAGRFQPVIDTVEAVDASTVRFELASPYPAFLALLTGAQAQVVSPVAWEDGDLDRNAVGTGPYAFVEWVSGERVVMQANASYWGGAPEVDRLVWTWSPEDAVMSMSLQAGEADVVGPLPPVFAPVVEANPDVDVMMETGSAVFWISLTTTNEPLGDPRVRRALNHATDKQGIVDALLRGYGVPATSPLAPPNFGFDDSQEGLPYDPELARELLAEAGVEGGFTVNLAVQEADADVAEAIQAQWADIGVDLNIQVMESGVWSDAAFADPEGKAEDAIDATYASWSTGTLDADGQLRPLYHSDSWSPDGANLGFYENARFDEILDEAASISDADRREELYAEAQEILVQEAPHVYLFYKQALAAKNADVGGIWLAPGGQLMIRKPTLN